MKKILTLSCLSMMIVACTQTDPAEIQDISDSSGGTTSSVYTKPPANISTGSSVSSVPTIDSSPTTTSHSSGVSGGNDVVTTQERIVYNRNYDSIPKGGYQGDSYTVKRGDTLFYIAWVTGNDYRALAAKNNVKEPYALNVGQVLDVSGGTTVVVTEKTTTSNVASSSASTSTAASSSTAKPKPVMTTTTTTTTTTSSKTQPTQTTQTTQTVTQPVSTTSSATDTASSAPSAKATVANISWQWPAKGKIIEKFSNASKGIDISGSLGDKVVAAADGRVVYSGNALPGYGNLIIIKHNDDYLTAYAHNQSILVKEQQSVRAGEQIASMGATGTSTVRLHFEIRYKAQSVDPLKYLPN